MKRFFETSRTVAAPVDQVWQVMYDVTRWPEWTPTVTSVDRLDEGPFGLGSRVEIRQPKLPKAQWEVTEVTEGPGEHSFTWEAAGPGMRTVAQHRITPREGGCTVTLSIEQRGPMGAVAALVWRGLTQRYIETEAASLDRHVTQTSSR